MHYRDKDFNLLKLALSTLVQFTPKSALHEIIIIDDCTEDAAIQRDEKLFMAKPEFHGINIRTYRSKTKDNYAVSWAKAARQATGDILVFVDSDVIFNIGWYEPIIDFLIQRPDAVAIPRSEAMLADARYVGFIANYVNVISWRLSILHYDNRYSNDTNTATTPNFRGDLFAMHKTLYESLGGLDEAFTFGEGSELEFSLRTWLCGGEIHVVKCSQIAVHNVLTPRDIHLPTTYNRIVHLWLDQYADLVSKQTSHKFYLTEEDKKSLQLRKKKIENSRGQTCKDFDWYLEHVATMIKVPSEDWKEFGKIRDSTGFCMKLSSTGNTVEVVLCNPPLYQPDMILEYTSKKHLMVSGKCLMSNTEKPLTFEICENSVGISQLWTFSSDGLIKSKSSGFCVQHIRAYNSDSDSMVHQAGLRPCDSTINTQRWTFIRY